MESTITQKQLEIRQREERILAVSRPMLAEQGYHGLNMDRIAEKLQYSKGTIYNHFSCKEEIIIALAIETMEKRIDLFSRAAMFRGNSRERFQAIGFAAELFVKMYPNHFSVEQIIRSASIWEKTSEKRRSVVKLCEHRCTGIVAGVVLDAISQGDLELPDGFTPQDLVFGVWSHSSGAYSIIATNDSLQELGISEPFSVVRRNINMQLDGFGWKPFSGDFDIEAVIKRIIKEVFADECR